MWIAETTLSDGIAIVIFATVIFLILFGIVAFVKWILHLINGNPIKRETVVLVIEYKHQKDEAKEEGDEDIRKFVWHLHSKIAEAKTGHFSASRREHNELLICFEGPDANRIWNLLDPEVTKHSPERPLRIVLKRTKKNGGSRIIDSIPWLPNSESGFQPPPEVEIPAK